MIIIDLCRFRDIAFFMDFMNFFSSKNSDEKKLTKLEILNTVGFCKGAVMNCKYGLQILLLKLFGFRDMSVFNDFFSFFLQKV